MNYRQKKRSLSLDEKIELGLETLPAYIREEPVISDYGLTSQAIVENSQARNKQRTIIVWVSRIIVLATCWYVAFYLYRPSKLDLGLILGFCFGALWPGAIVYAVLYQIFNSIFLGKPNSIESRLNEYERDTAHFRYWQQKKKKDFWLNLTGHQFELALAKVYRKMVILPMLPRVVVMVVSILF